MRTHKILQAAFASLACTALTVVSLPPVQARTQEAMNQAAQRNAERADAAMNISYKKLMTVLNPAQKIQIKKVQRAWLSFRDAEADFLSSSSLGGSVHPMVYENHVQGITEERTRELRRVYRQFTTEGDL